MTKTTTVARYATAISRVVLAKLCFARSSPMLSGRLRMIAAAVSARRAARTLPAFYIR
jgi:hypothetical protein